jgi:hypothetical protein
LGHLAGAAAVVHLHADQFAHEMRARRLRGVVEVVLDPRPLTGVPGGFKAVTMLIQVLHLGG